MRPCDSVDQLDQSFFLEFRELGIEEGTLIRTVTGTIRRVEEILYKDDCPSDVLTRIESGNSMEGKTRFTIREVVLGFRKRVASKVYPRRSFPYEEDSPTRG